MWPLVREPQRSFRAALLRLTYRLAENRSAQVVSPPHVSSGRFSGCNKRRLIEDDSQVRVSGKNHVILAECERLAANCRPDLHLVENRLPVQFVFVEAPERCNPSEPICVPLALRGPRLVMNPAPAVPIVGFDEQVQVTPIPPVFRPQKNIGLPYLVLDSGNGAQAVLDAALDLAECEEHNYVAGPEPGCERRPGRHPRSGTRSDANVRRTTDRRRSHTAIPRIAWRCVAARKTSRIRRAACGLSIQTRTVIRRP